MAIGIEQKVDAPTRSKYLSDWSKSGLSKVAFCEQHGITVNQLMYWQKGERLHKLKAKAAFVRAESVSASTQTESPPQLARLMVGGKSVLEISTSVDPIWVARVIAAVGVPL